MKVPEHTSYLSRRMPGIWIVVTIHTASNRKGMALTSTWTHEFQVEPCEATAAPEVLGDEI